MSNYAPPKLLEHQKNLLEIVYTASEDYAMLETMWHAQTYERAIHKTLIAITELRAIQDELQKIYRKHHKRYKLKHGI